MPVRPEKERQEPSARLHPVGKRRRLVFHTVTELLKFPNLFKKREQEFNRSFFLEKKKETYKL